MKCLRSDRGIKVGDKFKYRSRGLFVDGSWVNRGAEYYAEVIDTSTHLITLRISVDQLTMQGESSVMGNPTAYNWSIRRIDIGRTEKLMLIEDEKGEGE